MKSINSQTSNSSPRYDGGLKSFSNKLAPVYLDVYNSWGKLGTISVTSKTRIISHICHIKVIKEILKTIDSLYF